MKIERGTYNYIDTGHVVQLTLTRGRNGIECGKPKTVIVVLVGILLSY